MKFIGKTIWIDNKKKNKEEKEAKITNVYDADTCRAVFFLGEKLVKYTIRLKGIDTPEIRPKKTVELREQEIKAAKKYVKIISGGSKNDPHFNKNYSQFSCRKGF